jgi:exonuclease SbcC
VRPLRLTVESFTCFKERQGPLDLSGLELFAIAGPTGAGKSSLLDAIIFALYGRVPRMRRGYSELISLGRDRMSVTLDFRVGLREFRIARIGRRGRSAEAQLDELTGGGERSIAGGVQSVDDQVVRLLGLRYEAFTQAVVLPQGEFARFLKSQPRERREILRDLLRLQVYERMRRAAAESNRELELRLGGVRERLSEDYAEVEPRQLSDLERNLKTLTKDHVRMTEELAALQKDVEDKRAGHQSTRELTEKKTRLAELIKGQGQIETVEKRLAAARKVSPLLPLMEAAHGAERRSEEDRRRSLESVDALRAIRATHEEAADRLQAARRRADELPDLTKKIQALDELKGLLGPRESAARRRDEARARLGSIERSIEAASKEGLRARETVQSLERDLDAITKQLDSLGYDAEKDRKLDGVRDRASALAAQREAMAEAAHDARETRERASRERQIASETKALVAKLRKTLHAATRVREKAEAERQQTERAHAAAHLRHQLEPGGKCPVCGQAVAKLPRARDVASLDEIASRLEEARGAEERARSSMEKEVEAEAGARASANAFEREAEAVEKRAARLGSSVERGERELFEVLGGVLDSEPGANLEERILSAIRRTTERREIHQQHLRQRDELERKILDARRAFDMREQTSSTLKEQLQEAYTRTREAEEEIAQLQEKIAAVTKDPDPAKERERLAALKHEIEECVKRTQEAERTAGADLSATSKAVEEAERSARESARVALGARKRVLEALRAAGFRDEEMVHRAALAPADADRMESEVTAHRRERHALEVRVAELQKSLRGNEVSEQDLRHLEEELTFKRRDHEEGLQRKAQLEHEVNELRRRMERAAELSARRASLEQEVSLFRRLATDLRSENFQAYLLEEAFRELVAGASLRLQSLSGRYTLDYQQDAFQVLDQENAGERRSADTLSGGETFLASLALALELSEQVQRAAGAVNLDSLFIDEGFGTLDSETLDTVASAIESLHVGGRMVGIITHLPELTERLPARILVERSAEGSRVCPPTY